MNNIYDELCPNCSEPAQSVTKGIPSYAKCSNNHQWQRGVVIKDDIKSKLSVCARCGSNHDNISYKQLFNPIDEFTHYALCPNNGQPILMKTSNA